MSQVPPRVALSPAEQSMPVGVSRIEMPVGMNSIESVNVYVLADHNRVTLVDCGVWQPGSEDSLPALERGLNATGYTLRDISRLIVTHAHIDHYGLAGRLVELTGAELLMHAMTDLDCEKYRHPDTARARRRDTYADHGIGEADLADVADSLARWMPYLYSVVEASTRLHGGETIDIGGRRYDVLHTPGHSLGHICLWDATGRVLFSGDHLLPGVTPPVTFERGFDADPLRSYLESLDLVADCDPGLVLPGHGRPFADARRRIDAIERNKRRRLQGILELIEAEPRSVAEIAELLVSRAILGFQRNMALAETLAHVAYLRGSGLIERRVRPDGVYEWYPPSTGAPPRIDR